MKRFAIIMALGLAGCQDVETGQNISNEWQIEWQLDEHTANGRLFLQENNQGRLIIDEPSASLINQTEDVNFTWEISDNHFIINRNDNNVRLSYKIIKRQTDYFELLYADEVIVKMARYLPTKQVATNN